LPDEQFGKIRLKIDGENFTFDSGDDSHGGLYKIDPGMDPQATRYRHRPGATKKGRSIWSSTNSRTER
jgi:hypothetical protein